MTPIEFCPASACANLIGRLDAYFELVQRGLARASDRKSGVPDMLLQQMEAHADEVLMDLEAARWRLAEADAVSPAGAMAQLLAAIRDYRVGDDEELARARALEARAHAFFRRARVLAPETAVRLSQSIGTPEGDALAVV
ncbi:MAG: hypothetical protein R3C52_07300 [Hyphomonadaceae bacterium]